MKKFFVLLLIVTLAAFVFVGCDLIPSEGEGEGEPEKPAVSVEVDGAVEVGGKAYVSEGNHDVTVTLSAPLASGRVSVYLSPCMGDYSKANGYYYGWPIYLTPNADKTEWTGNAFFGCCGEDPCDRDEDTCYPTCSTCCLTLIEVDLGECDACNYVTEVIVDALPPYACIDVTVPECPCEAGCCADGCQVKFSLADVGNECAADTCCGDDCSGLKEWTIDIYNSKPVFNETTCKITSCVAVDSFTGTDCPIEWTTKCLTAGESEASTKVYYVVLTLKDNVDNIARYFAKLSLWLNEQGEEEVYTVCDYDIVQYEPDLCNCTGTSWECEVVEYPCAGDIGACDPCSLCFID